MVHSEISLFCMQQHKELRGLGKKKVLIFCDTASVVLIPHDPLFAVLPNINVLKTTINGYWTNS